jgi:hypothetical protein
MVNNSNLNKINNYPSPQLTEQKQSPGLGQHKNVEGLNWLMESQPSLFLTTYTND